MSFGFWILDHTRRNLSLQVEGRPYAVGFKDVILSNFKLYTWCREM